MPSDDLAVTLAILRIVRRWSQTELAQAAEVTNSAISDYERGKVDPQTATLHKIMRALGLPFSTLDQTQAFIQMIRAQMDAGEPLPSAPRPANASAVLPQEHELRVEIAQVASEGGRFASRLTRLMLELLVSRGVPPSQEDARR